MALEGVERRRRCPSHRGPGPENVLVRGVLENSRRAAIEEHGELLQLLCHGCDRKAVPAGDVADDEVGALREIAELRDLLLRTAGLVDDDELDRPAGRRSPSPHTAQARSRRSSAPRPAQTSLRAGTPNGPAAGPDRKVTMPMRSGRCASAACAAIAQAIKIRAARNQANHGCPPPQVVSATRNSTALAAYCGSSFATKGRASRG